MHTKNQQCRAKTGVEETTLVESYQLIQIIKTTDIETRSR